MQCTCKCLYFFKKYLTMKIVHKIQNEDLDVKRLRDDGENQKI